MRFVKHCKSPYVAVRFRVFFFYNNHLQVVPLLWVLSPYPVVFVVFFYVCVKLTSVAFVLTAAVRFVMAVSQVSAA